MTDNIDDGPHPETAAIVKKSLGYHFLAASILDYIGRNAVEGSGQGTNLLVFAGIAVGAFYIGRWKAAPGYDGHWKDAARATFWLLSVPFMLYACST